MRRFLLACVIALSAQAAHAETASYPVEVQSCLDRVRFDAAPKRPVVNDFNMTQTVLDLGLAPRFVGFAGIQGGEQELVAAPGVVAGLKQFSDRYPTMETILGQDADFYFAGWQYGFSEADVTPAKLSELGVKSYVLYESCIRIGPRPPVAMETMYADISALGQIFGIEPQAEAMVADYRRRVAAVTDKTAQVARRPRIMYCGGCDNDSPPRTIGTEGMPRLLFDLAGGRNVFDDIKDSYVNVSWDTVIDRDPEWIVISNPRVPHEDSIKYLTSSPALQTITAVKKRQFVFMTYAERSPSTRNVDALERLAKTIHPELFAN